MGIWTHSLQFNVGTGGSHRLPQTTGGIHSLLQEVVWDAGDNVPNPVLQLFHCASFCPVHFLLCPVPQEKVTGHEIWTSCRPFVRSSSSQPTSRKLLIQPGMYAQCKVWWCTIVHENKFINIFPARYDRPHVIFQHLKIVFSIHGVMQKVWADDPSVRHSAPHGHFWTILHLLHCHFGIVCHPAMAIMSTDETAGTENGLIAPQNAAFSNLRSFQQSSSQPSLLPFRVLPLSATAHTIDRRIIKSYFVMYIYTLFSL